MLSATLVSESALSFPWISYMIWDPAEYYIFAIAYGIEFVQEFDN